MNNYIQEKKNIVCVIRHSLHDAIGLEDKRPVDCNMKNHEGPKGPWIFISRMVVVTKRHSPSLMHLSTP